MSEKKIGLNFANFLKGHLRTAILKALEHGELHGYGIIKKIEQTTGVWRPTTGSIYPMLSQMHREKIIEVKKAEHGGRKKIFYSITRKGLKELQSHKKMIEPMLKNMNQLFETLFPKEAESPEKLLKLLSNSKELGKEGTETRAKFVHFLALRAKGKIPKEKEENVRKRLSELREALEEAIGSKDKIEKKQ
jgi:DNA-binding PadR family transcriptional regulator